MIVLDDDAYEWHETTTIEDQARGRRTFVRGKPKDEAARLRDNFSALADRLSEAGNETAAEQIRRLLR